MNRTSLLYFIVVSAAALSIFWILRLGAALVTPSGASLTPAATVAIPVPAADAMVSALEKNAASPFSHLFLQLLIIIAVSRAVGYLFTRLGQPAVVGEMAAGILLGPSLFGMLAPASFAFVFPSSSLGALKLLSEVGVCLFMFCVGMELNVGLVRNKAQTAVVVSHASIVVPYLLGVGLAYLLYSHLAAAGASFTAFALFMGICMSITAFPVLARILQERRLTRTLLGSTAITCAAVDDVTAWSILAFVVAIVRSASVAACALNLLLVFGFVAVMIWGVRPLLPRWLGAENVQRDEPAPGTLAIVICVTIAAALCTEIVGIHALFGAFIAGAIMPEANGFRHKLAVRLENFSSVLLLPLFFAFTGLRTQLGLLNDWSGWLTCLGIIAVATLGKMGGSTLTARFTGMSWAESLQLGALMNTRGLMELIALNMGYDLGILSPRIFTMMVIMALVTTTLTGPLLTLFRERQPAFENLPHPLRS